MTETQPFGKATHYLLSEVTPLMQPRRPDRWGIPRPQASAGFLRMSAELAHTAYTMEVAPWLAAGWRDITIQVDGDLTDGIAEGKTTLERLTSAWKLRRVKARMRGYNPLGQMLGAVRQIKSSDTGKAVVMLRPLPDGRYAVAIGFTGTAGRAHDWISNFRMTAENGIHKGFWQLSKQLEDNEESICFPQTARELGLERLTLRDILQECRHENSRFLIWMAGHSQGGAVMQVWTHQKLREDGVLPNHLLGCGFASPSVATGTAVMNAAAHPLLHVVNTDDAVPRMGAMVHLGGVLLYSPGAKLKQMCYARPTDAESVRRYNLARPILTLMRDTPSCLTLCAAYLRLLQEYPLEEVIGGLGWLENDLRLTRKVMDIADDRADDLLRHLCRKCIYAYESITGRPMNMRREALMGERLRAATGQLGVRGLSDALLQLMSGPHCMTAKKGTDIGTYPCIAMFGAEKMTEARWLTGERPVLLLADGETPLVCLRVQSGLRRAVRVPHRMASRSRWDGRRRKGT